MCLLLLTGIENLEPYNYNKLYDVAVSYVRMKDTVEIMLSVCLQAFWFSTNIP